jgi:hypothetical protein
MLGINKIYNPYAKAKQAENSTDSVKEIILKHPENFTETIKKLTLAFGKTPSTAEVLQDLFPNNASRRADADFIKIVENCLQNEIIIKKDTIDDNSPDIKISDRNNDANLKELKEIERKKFNADAWRHEKSLGGNHDN